MKGEAYKGVRNSEDKYMQDVERRGRNIGPPCNSEFCKKSKDRNCDQFSQEKRKEIHEAFWKQMGWNQRKVYVSTLVDRVATKQKTVSGNSRRDATLLYNLKLGYEKKRVCKNTFLQT